jgi:hypothetical protein
MRTGDLYFNSLESRVYVYDGESWIVVSGGIHIDSSGNVGVGTSSPNARLVVEESGSQAAVRITQTGSGNALIVEDETSPDASPFVVDAAGRVLIGNTSAETVGVDSHVQMSSPSHFFGITRLSSNANSGAITFAKSRSTTYSAKSAILNNDTIGNIVYRGDDGTNWIPAAHILVSADGNASTGSMPGRITFSTTPSGSSTPTERMRITNSGNVGIGTTPLSSTRLHVMSDSGGGTQTTLALQALFEDDTAAQVAFHTNNTGTNSIYFRDSDTTGNSYRGMIRYAHATDSLRFDTSATERIRIDSSGNVGIGTTSPEYKLEVNGSFAATTKSFVIDHPTKENMKLQHGSLEGPENGVYVRGKSSSSKITLPEYWTGLVDPDSITVQLTSIGQHRNLYVVDISNNAVSIGGVSEEFEFFYFIQAERKDVEKLVVEYGS